MSSQALTGARATLPDPRRPSPDAMPTRTARHRPDTPSTGSSDRFSERPSERVAGAAREGRVSRRLGGVVALVLTGLCASAAAQDGLQSVSSPHDVPTTLDRLSAALESKGLTVFARIDHAANAEGAGLELAPTQVLLFGNPKLGTPLMACAPTMAIDLPQKMLAFVDATGATRLAWNDPAWLASRHGIAGDDCADVLATVSGALQNFATRGHGRGLACDAARS